ncbi:redoxin family protein [Streptococcus infantis]|uniref:redoxin family protein n=1 Tax=Streptococcus infantis TaxID=68892 RepID=UPI001CC01C1A|nr:redoxin family protein [Streptococcus infantis]MBZ2110328.1 redoxin family protein [Streptococcus infantis]MBZ2112176.1 redoxin family protein [Streptococcus infantis]MBZ2118895.1 redoxin family protein [Streptococcus infantis]
MKKWQASVLICTSLVCLSACKNQTTSETDKQSGDKKAQVSSQTVKKGEAVADFELTAMDGRTYHLSDYKGKKVYLKFWASWCSICLASLPDTDELAKEASDDYVVLTVVSPGQKGEQAEEAFKKWYQGLDYKNLPVLLDPSGQLLSSYGVRSYPTQAFIDKEGKLVKTQPGFMDKETILENLKTMN